MHSYFLTSLLSFAAENQHKSILHFCQEMVRATRQSRTELHLSLKEVHRKSCLLTVNQDIQVFKMPPVSTSGGMSGPSTFDKGALDNNDD